MSLLKEKLDAPGFKIGLELVSTRGTMSEAKAMNVRHFSNALIERPEIDWISITDNAGGHPSISATALGRPILFANKEVIIHVTCKDLNRNGLESKAWELASEGFNNVLAITGDYPVSGMAGTPKPVFDIDSVGLLHLMSQLNQGIEIGKKKKKQLLQTDFFLGAVVSNFKKHENELVPQYLKLLKKIESGASFIINQAGYDAAKMSELPAFLIKNNLAKIPLIGNVFVLSKFSSQLFNKNKIPGVVLTDRFFSEIQKYTSGSDKGKAYFLELAAKMLAIYKGLGYKGGYIGGIHKIEDYETIMRHFHSFAEDDWVHFAKALQYHQKEEFFFFARNPDTGLVLPEKLNPNLEKRTKTKNINFNYQLSKRFHNLLFTEGKGLYNTGKKLCQNTTKGSAPTWLYSIEKLSKRILFDCKDCGDCSLSQTGYLCPESQCAKNQRNGPCGGTHDGFCEVKNIACIWARAYDRKKYEGHPLELLDHAPVMQNHALEGTSSWGNFWLGLDHFKASKIKKQPNE